MASRGISIPVRIQNELAAGLDVASADLRKFVDSAVQSANDAVVEALAELERL